MWQEHSPAEVAGLERLGFTATKLRATGGGVEPGRTRRTTSPPACPGISRTLATDFYAPYHRYTRRQAGQLACSRGQGAPPRRPGRCRASSSASPASPTRRGATRIADRLRALVAAQSRYHPLFYNLADEAGIADLAAAWDFDLGPTRSAAMRDWLRTQYPSLPALDTGMGRRLRSAGTTSSPN